MRRVWLVLAALAPIGCAPNAAPDAAPNAAPDAVLLSQQGRVPQFVAECEVSHFAFDDPILHPGHAGASHQHAFFGNTSVTAESTYDDLLGAGTTCDQPLDTASYWTPVLLDADGRRVGALGAVAYYRPGAGIEVTSLVPYPPDLRLVAGDADANGRQPLSVVAWSCGVSAVREVEPPRCAERSTLRLLVTFPDCWDGERTWVDRPDDPSDRHAVYSSGGACPETHPVPIPQLQLAVDHPPVDPEGLTLSSGPVHTAHADFWNVWDQAKLTVEVERCLHRGLVCWVAGNRG